MNKPPHLDDTQGNPDEWVQRQLRELREISRKHNREIDTFAETVALIRKNGSIKGVKRG